LQRNPPQESNEYLSIEGALNVVERFPHSSANSIPLPSPALFRGRGNQSKDRPRLRSNRDSARLTERLDLLDRDGPWPGTSSRGVCRIGLRAVSGRHFTSDGIAACEFPRDFESMRAAADLRRNEVETVRRQSADNKIPYCSFDWRYTH
jgi:hypothetical protein